MKMIEHKEYKCLLYTLHGTFSATAILRGEFVDIISDDKKYSTCVYRSLAERKFTEDETAMFFNC